MLTNGKSYHATWILNHNSRDTWNIMWYLSYLVLDEMAFITELSRDGTVFLYTDIYMYLFCLLQFQTFYSQML
jgi:hypothetical protein